VRGRLHDSSGTAWFDFDFGAQRLDVRFRADREWRFVPIEGPARPMPDSLTLDWDFRTKIWIFSLGLTGLASDFVVLHTPTARGWFLGFRREPHWHLPFAVDHLVKASLRRPFADDGAHYRVIVTDTGSHTTRLVRDGRVIVQESTIMHWLGHLAARALGEFFGPAEAQESAYFAAVFRAFRTDLRADLASAGGVAGEVEPKEDR
jgi:hypothetical protein